MLIFSKTVEVFGSKHHYITYINTGAIITVLHREDGPAAEWDNGDSYWYINGRQVYVSSLKEFRSSKEYKLWKLKAFL